VRLTTVTTHNPETGAKELGVRATVKAGNREIAAQGADDENAIRALKAKLADHEKQAEFRRQYPKTVEVEL
jgi:hypothetical protein